MFWFSTMAEMSLAFSSSICKQRQSQAQVYSEQQVTTSRGGRRSVRAEAAASTIHSNRGACLVSTGASVTPAGSQPSSECASTASGQQVARRPSGKCFAGSQEPSGCKTKMPDDIGQSKNPLKGTACCQTSRQQGSMKTFVSASLSQSTLLSIDRLHHAGGKTCWSAAGARVAPHHQPEEHLAAPVGRLLRHPRCG